MASDCRSPPDRPPTSWLPSVTRVMPRAFISSTATDPAVFLSNRLNGPHPRVGSSPTKNDRPMVISAKVPPVWWTVDIPYPWASRGLANLTFSPLTSTVPELGWWTPDITLIRVDLPAPLSPRRHRTLP